MEQIKAYPTYWKHKRNDRMLLIRESEDKGTVRHNSHAYGTSFGSKELMERRLESEYIQIAEEEFSTLLTSDTCECGTRHPLVKQFGKCGKCWEENGRSA